MDYSRKTGAKIHAVKSGRCDSDHIALSECDDFKIGNVKLSMLEMPGHTPEHITYVVRDTN